MESSGPGPYVFDRDRSEEEQRLIAQSRLLDPMTEEFLRDAGLGPGMHVVDLGSGAGDTALVAARLVGPAGSVLGVERSEPTVAMARRRVAEAGVGNVTFHHGDLHALADVLAARPGPVDAVIGRFILMWVADRVDVLRGCADRLRPGTLVWFLEPDMDYDYAMPATPLWRKVRDWLNRTLAGVGVESRMGPKLHAAFREAGLPSPELRGRTFMAGPEAAPVWFYANIIRGMLPAMEELGVATADEVAVDRLAERLTAELDAADGAMIGPPCTAAWIRIPD